IYSSADCFVFPSKVEGFGIPLLEAARCNCPLACSDIPVFRSSIPTGRTTRSMGALNLPSNIVGTLVRRGAVGGRCRVRVGLHEHLHDSPVDCVDEHETPLQRRFLGAVAEDAPGRPGTQPPPHLLGGRMTDDEADVGGGTHERLPLVEVHAPSARETDESGKSQDARPEQCPVVDDDRGVPVRGDPHGG
ncbi:MAG: glycosyltransferase, partial [Actinobacteria bacterium]|nr:glycosyltransferase [Actinomycetota bacterium]